MNLRQAYKTLEIPESATLSMAKEAYRDLTQIWHPDRHTQNDRLQKRAAEKMKELNAAYECIRLHFDSTKAAVYTDRSSDTDRFSETIVVCTECRTKNRFKSFNDKARARCGMCGAHLFWEHNKTEDKSGYVLCGDGACIGIISDATGRCNECGRTLAQGAAAEKERIKAKNQKQNDEKLSLRRRKKITYGLVLGSIIFSLLYLLNSSPSLTSGLKAAPSTNGSRSKGPTNLAPANPNRLRTGANVFSAGISLGHSEITIENGTDLDAVVRALRNANGTYQNIRSFYVRAHDRFVTKRIPPGEYILKVAFGKDWNSEKKRFSYSKYFSETQSFKVEETTWTENTVDGDVFRTRSSSLSITLHKVPHGNFHSHGIDEEGFWQ